MRDAEGLREERAVARHGREIRRAFAADDLGERAIFLDHDDHMRRTVRRRLCRDSAGEEDTRERENGRDRASRHRSPSK